MVIILSILGVLFVGLGGFSLIHRYRQQSYLNRALKVDESFKKRVANEFGIDGAIVAGVTIFDVLYNSLKISPDSLSGINHLHHSKSFESLADLMSFLKSEIIKSESGDAAWRQMIHKYKGYTGEETAFSNLTDAGYEIKVPESGTSEGFDVLIDGKPYNVKVTDNPKYIQEHLEQHPDVDIIANKEMGEAFGNHPRVKIDPDLSSQEAFHETADTFEGISDMGDGIDSVPIITLAINTLRNAKKAYSGKIDISTAVEYTVVDTVGVGAGGWVGGKAGLYIGLALAPVTGGTSAIVIPAVTTILGSIIGIFAGKGLSGWFKERHLRAAMNKLRDIATNFHNVFLELFDKVIKVSNNYFNELLKIVRVQSKNEGPIKRTLFPNTTTTFYKMTIKRLKIEKNNSHQFYNELKSTINNAEPSEGGMILYAQGPEILNEIEPLITHYEEIDSQLKVVENEKMKLS